MFQTTYTRRAEAMFSAESTAMARTMMCGWPTTPNPAANHPSRNVAKPKGTFSSTTLKSCGGSFHPIERSAARASRAPASATKRVSIAWARSSDFKFGSNW